VCVLSTVIHVVCRLNELLGNITGSFYWLMITVYINVLAINRLLEFTSKLWSERVFGGHRVYVSKVSTHPSFVKVRLLSYIDIFAKFFCDVFLIP
jgi:hypothetical protein